MQLEQSIDFSQFLKGKQRQNVATYEQVQPLQQNLSDAKQLNDLLWQKISFLRESLKNSTINANDIIDNKENNQFSDSIPKQQIIQQKNIYADPVSNCDQQELQQQQKQHIISQNSSVLEKNNQYQQVLQQTYQQNSNQQIALSQQPLPQNVIELPVQQSKQQMTLSNPYLCSQKQQQTKQQIQEVQKLQNQVTQIEAQQRQDQSFPYDATTASLIQQQLSAIQNQNNSIMQQLQQKQEQQSVSHADLLQQTMDSLTQQEKTKYEQTLNKQKEIIKYQQQQLELLKTGQFSQSINNDTFLAQQTLDKLQKAALQQDKCIESLRNSIQNQENTNYNLGEQLGNLGCSQQVQADSIDVESSDDSFIGYAHTM